MICRVKKVLEVNQTIYVVKANAQIQKFIVKIIVHLKNISKIRVTQKINPK